MQIQRRPVDGNRVLTVGVAFTDSTLGPLKIPQDRSRGDFGRGEAPTRMFNRFATLAAVCTLVPVGTAPLAVADDPPPPAVPAADTAPAPGPPGGPGPAGPVPSAPPGVLKTPDGYTLTVQGAA